MVGMSEDKPTRQFCVLAELFEVVFHVEELLLGKPLPLSTLTGEKQAKQPASNLVIELLYLVSKRVGANYDVDQSSRAHSEGDGVGHSLVLRCLDEDPTANLSDFFRGLEVAKMVREVVEPGLFCIQVMPMSQHHLLQLLPEEDLVVRILDDDLALGGWKEKVKKEKVI